MSEHPIENLMMTAMDSIQDMIDVNTIIGETIPFCFMLSVRASISSLSITLYGCPSQGCKLLISRVFFWIQCMDSKRVNWVLLHTIIQKMDGLRPPHIQALRTVVYWLLLIMHSLIVIILSVSMDASIGQSLQSM